MNNWIVECECYYDYEGGESKCIFCGTREECEKVCLDIVEKYDFIEVRDYQWRRDRGYSNDDKFFRGDDTYLRMYEIDNSKYLKNFELAVTI